MRTVLVFTLVFLAAGCDRSATRQESVMHEQDARTAIDNSDDKGITVLKIPRPNSGTYTTDRATELLPATLKRSAAVSRDHAIYTKWKNPTHGFRVFIHGDGTIETTNVLNETGKGMEGLKAALELSRAMQDGNPLGALIASETAGWTSETKSAIINMLFQPSIQLYIVGK